MRAVEDLGAVFEGEGREILINPPNGDRVVIAVDHDVFQQGLRPRDPAHAQPGQRIGLGHPRRADAPLVQIADRGGIAVPRLIGAAIDLIAEHPCAAAARDLGNLSQHRAIHQRAGRVVGVVGGNHPRVGPHHRAQLVKVGQEAVLGAQMQQFDLGADAFGDRVMLLVGRHDGDDMIAAANQRLMNQRIGPDGAVGGQHVLAGLGLVEPRHRVAQPVRALDRAIAHAHAAQLAQHGIVDARHVDQLTQGDRVHAGLGEVVAAVVLEFVHPHLDAEGLDMHCFSFRVSSQSARRRAGGGIAAWRSARASASPRRFPARARSRSYGRPRPAR